MSVIGRSRLLGQRLRLLEQRRAELAQEREQAWRATGLPPWAGEVLRRVGMTRSELAEFDRECAERSQRRSPVDVVAAMADLDRNIGEVEQELLACDADGVHRLEAMADVAVQRLRRIVATAGGDPQQRNERALAVMERLLQELRQLESGSLGRAV